MSLQIEIEKPLGLKLGDSKSPGGGLKVTGVSGNAAKSGLKVGDTVIYTSSFFGDELWPADKLGFARSAIGACPSPVCFVYVSLLASSSCAWAHQHMSAVLLLGARILPFPVARSLVKDLLRSPAPACMSPS